MGVINKLRIKTRAHAAAVSHRWPAKHMQIIFISGADGSQLTVVFLGHILQRSGAKIGIISSQFIEIAGERVKGSDKADVLGDPFRMQALLAQMKRAGCAYVIVEINSNLPAHSFAGVKPTLLVMRRCGDSHFNQAQNASRFARWQKLIALDPKHVVINRDDPCFATPELPQESTIMTFGAHKKAECRVESVEMHPKGTAISLLVDHQTSMNLATLHAGKTAIYSMVAAAAAAYMLHVPVEDIEGAALDLPNQPGALQYLPVPRPYAIVLDACSTPDGISDALEDLKHFTRNRLIAVVSANSSQNKDWRPVIGEIASKTADRIIVTDGEFSKKESALTVRQEILQSASAAGAEARTEDVPDREAAFEKALSIARRGDTIVILSVIQRPYRQLGNERLPWSDLQKIEELLS